MLMRCNEFERRERQQLCACIVQTSFVTWWAFAATKPSSTCAQRTDAIVCTSQRWPITTSYFATYSTWKPIATSQCASRFIVNLYTFVPFIHGVYKASILPLQKRLCFHFVTQTTHPIFIKFGRKVAHGPRKKPVDFGDNPQHVTLGLE